MFTPDCIIHYHGMTVRNFPAQYGWVYLIHFHTKLHHAGHYLGSTAALDYRLHAHTSGNGARLMEVITDAGISWELVRLWRCDTPEEARLLEKRLKSYHGHSPALCPICQGKPKDVFVRLREGHYPLASHVGKRQPSPRWQNVSLKGGDA